MDQLDDGALFERLGLRWDRGVIPVGVPVYDVKRTCFRLQKMLAEYVWDASVLEGNPFTYPQVQTILDGITVGGHKLSDQDQVRNLVASTKELLRLVKTGTFQMDKATFTALHGIVAREEAIKPNLNQIFSDGLLALEQLAHPLERGIIFFLFGALQQFFFDGNKRTSRMMMNGILMRHGIDAISIPAHRAQEFNEKMVDFYQQREGTTMLRFMLSCHPDAAVMR